MEKVNKATKKELLTAIIDKFKGRNFTHKQCLKLLPNFNHAQRIWALLTALVKDGSLEQTKTGYKVVEAKVKAVSTEDFVRDFCKGKKLPITATRLEIALSKTVGDTINVNNKKKAIAVIQTALTEKRKAVTASISMTCPRCGGSMQSVILSENREAYYCTNDRVTLPR